jgi:predicted SprT family Zn-dependent metalloprotease
MELTQAITLTTQLLVQHGLAAQGWGARLGRGSRRLGLCSHKRKVIKIARHHILNGTDKEVIDTILHEIAHALAGPNVMHGPEWQSWALKLGCSPRATGRVKYKMPHRYVIVCGKCNRNIQYRINKISKVRMDKLGCKMCGWSASNGHLVMKNYNANQSSLQPTQALPVNP